MAGCVSGCVMIEREGKILPGHCDQVTCEQLLKCWEASGIQVLPKNGHLPAAFRSLTKADSSSQFCWQLQTPSCRRHCLWHTPLRLLLVSKHYKRSLADLSKLQDTKSQALIQ